MMADISVSANNFFGHYGWHFGQVGVMATGQHQVSLPILAKGEYVTSRVEIGLWSVTVSCVGLFCRMPQRIMYGDSWRKGIT